MNNTHIAFIGGGNMASAIIGGLLRKGLPAANIRVVEPFAQARERLAQSFGVTAIEHADDSLKDASLVVWAVKPQTFREAAQKVASLGLSALHLSVAAGIRSDTIAGWLSNQRVVRAMPNTPALIGKGMTALFARDAVSKQDKALVDNVIATTGEFLWLGDEAQLDAVTALSGSGPAYVFYFLEAMAQAGVEMGLDEAQAGKLAIGTFVGAAQLASDSDESPQVLRERVTSKGGTTYAAITSMEHDQMKALFIRALHAAQKRAKEMGDEFGTAS